jgi:predicted alpha/beta-fold hydrolase
MTEVFKPPFPFTNGHFSTVYASNFRKVAFGGQQRERLELADGDFLDLDWSFAPWASDTLVVLFHGLEGNAQRPYMLGAARVFVEAGIDVCSVNLRGCSGETNRLFRSYHSGGTEDVEAVLQFVLEKNRYKQLFFKGFSLGGNLVLRYCGEGRSLPKELKGVIGVSVPCDLYDSLCQLLDRKNRLYEWHFRKKLVAKLLAKQERFPDKLALSDIQDIKSLWDVDELYTSKAHGFVDALDYYAQCSCLPVLEHIPIRALIINAKNDSFLGAACYPESLSNPQLKLEIPQYGGHVGYYFLKKLAYNESRALKFVKQFL